MKFKSSVYTAVSGSVGGLTYAWNQGGMYARARAMPTDPSSPHQQAIRQSVATLTSHWADELTVNQRGLWNYYSDQVPLLDTLGEPRKVGGLAMFVRTNVIRLQAGLAILDDAPLTYNLGTYTAPTIGSISAGDGEADIHFNNANPWATTVGGAMLVYASRPQNESINFFKGPYRLAGVILGAATPPTSPKTVTLPFQVAVDTRVFFQFRVLQADGRLSYPFRLYGTAAA